MAASGWCYAPLCAKRAAVNRRSLFLLMVSLSLGVVPGVQAQSPDLERAFMSFGDHVLLTFPGRAEAVGGYVDGMMVEFADPRADDRLPDDLSLTSRLRIAPSLILHGSAWPLFGAYQVSCDVDMHYDTGQVMGDERLAYDPVIVRRGEIPRPRLLQANASAIGEHLGLSFGLVRSSWGMGMLSNDGKRRDLLSGASPFGYARHVDRVVRAQVLVFPLGRPAERGPEGETLEPPLTIALAADAVVEDDTANWVHGDRTWHAIGAVRGRIAGLSGGLYGVHRWQTHAEGGETQVTVLDLHARQEFGEGALRIWAELEVAVTVGETTYAENPLLPGPQDVLAGGGLFRVGFKSGPLGVLLEGGYASGDDNPFDTEQRAFTFDREHRVGLMMFRETLRRSTAVTVANIADPTYRATPPRGYQRAATHGAVRGALYINPRLTFDLFEGFRLMAGYLHATSDGYYADSFQSGLAGGASMGPRGVFLTRSFGDELDLGVSYALDLGALTLEFRGEFAWFSPGDIFSSTTDRDPSDQVGGWLHGEVRW